MTEAKAIKKERAAAPRWQSGAMAAVMLLAMLLLSLSLSDEIAGFAKEGLRIAISFVIPSAFPFMILCDLYAVYGCPERIKPICWFMERVLRISRAGARAYISGNLSGFPIGAVATAELYRGGEISKSEADRLLILSTTPSPAFILGAVGYGMLKNKTAGFLILATLLLSQLTFGVICGVFSKKTENAPVISGQRFDFPASVKSAGLNCVTVAAFVVFFRCVSGALSILIPIKPVSLLFTATLEVTGAVSYFAALPAIGRILRHSAICFSLGFGGISVLMQSAAFLSGTDLSVSKFFFGKLINGVVAAVIGGVLSLIFGGVIS